MCARHSSKLLQTYSLPNHSRPERWGLFLCFSQTWQQQRGLASCPRKLRGKGWSLGENTHSRSLSPPRKGRTIPCSREAGREEPGSTGVRSEGKPRDRVSSRRTRYPQAPFTRLVQRKGFRLSRPDSTGYEIPPVISGCSDLTPVKRRISTWLPIKGARQETGGPQTPNLVP